MTVHVCSHGRFVLCCTEPTTVQCSRKYCTYTVPSLKISLGKKGKGNFLNDTGNGIPLQPMLKQFHTETNHVRRKVKPKTTFQFSTFYFRMFSIDKMKFYVLTEQQIFCLYSIRRLLFKRKHARNSGAYQEGEGLLKYNASPNNKKNLVHPL